ncbi:hypothetical protein [Atopobium fossor]|uniref:hypothetical protein n=1 Tax=Atopobium fossor TaxID=39487 RepID=UPI000413F087|nr:hypothetical protein [Atopobium fossor]
MGFHKAKQNKFLSSDEAEKLFETLDETGHSNKEVAAVQHKRRAEKGNAVDIDPLSNNDPSGSTIDRTIRRTAVGFVVITLVVVTLAQTSCGLIRRITTGHLSEEVNITTVSRSMRNGIEWGNGFTSFPEEFSVEQADESSGVVEVTVIDTTSDNAAEAFSSSQVQASALSINALLNPKVHAVIYHVNVRVDEQGNFLHNAMFGFLRPMGTVRNFMTFIWTKNTSDQGVNFTCRITGLDEETTAGIRDKLQANIVLSKILPTTEKSDAAPAPTSDGESESSESSSVEVTTSDSTQTSKLL